MNDTRLQRYETSSLNILSMICTKSRTKESELSERE